MSIATAENYADKTARGLVNLPEKYRTSWAVHEFDIASSRSSEMIVSAVFSLLASSWSLSSSSSLARRMMPCKRINFSMMEVFIHVSFSREAIKVCRCDFFSRVGVYVYRIAVVVVRIPVPTASIVPVHIGTVVSRMWPNPDLRSRHR